MHTTHWAEGALFRPPQRGTLAQAITDHLRRRIVSGDLPPGRRLPPVRRLAHLFGVSVPTVESALHGLKVLGFVRVAPGVGIYVAHPRDHTVLLNYVWRTASITELAIVRAAIDQGAPPIVAARVATRPPVRLPRTLSDISFFAHERSVERHGHPEGFLDADLAFHRTILASLRGVEIGPALYERVAVRLRPALMGVADVQASDHVLDFRHLDLAAAILDGDAATTARLARAVANQERRSLESALG